MGMDENNEKIDPNIDYFDADSFCELLRKERNSPEYN